MSRILKSLVVVLLLLIAATPAAQAQRRRGRAPRFEDYPVREIYRGQAARVLLDTRRARMYRSALREGAREGANFAGHYAVVWWGCGTGCAQMAVVDVKSGRVTFLPLEYIDIPERENEAALRRIFRLDSRLLVVTRSYYDGTPTYTAFYYLLEGGRLRLLQKREEPRPDREPDAAEPAARKSETENPG